MQDRAQRKFVHKLQKKRASLEKRQEKSDPEKIETEDVELVPGRTTQFGKKLAEGDKEKLVCLLLMKIDLFAYSPSDMPGVDPGIIQR